MITLFFSLFAFLFGLLVYDYYTNRQLKNMYKELSILKMECNILSKKLSDYETDVQLIDMVITNLTKKPVRKKTTK